MTLTFHLLEQAEVVRTIIEIELCGLCTRWVEGCFKLSLVLFEVARTLFLGDAR